MASFFLCAMVQIWEQLRSRGERLDAFVMSAGTGGSIAGASRYFKARRPSVQIVLVDPPGSSLYNKVRCRMPAGPS